MLRPVVICNGNFLSPDIKTQKNVCSQQGIDVFLCFWIYSKTSGTRSIEMEIHDVTLLRKSVFDFTPRSCDSSVVVSLNGHRVFPPKNSEQQVTGVAKSCQHNLHLARNKVFDNIFTARNSPLYIRNGPLYIRNGPLPMQIIACRKATGNLECCTVSLFSVRLKIIGSGTRLTMSQLKGVVQISRRLYNYIICYQIFLQVCDTLSTFNRGEKFS